MANKYSNKEYAHREVRISALMEELSRAIHSKDIPTIELLYRQCLKEGVSPDFWVDEFIHAQDWLLEILVRVKVPLTIFDIALIPSDDWFYKLLQGNVDMTGWHKIVGIDSSRRDAILKKVSARL